MQLVGVTGYAQHGKDTFGKRLVEAHGFTRYAFADALKSMALALNPIIGSGVTVPRLADVVEAHGWEVAKAEPEVRRFLQVLGTEGVRQHVGEDSWVYALAQRIARDGAERVVITDVRFPNEARWLKHIGGLLVRVDRVVPMGKGYAVKPFDNGVGAEHPSEAHIADLPVDRVVVNNGTEDFLRLIDEVMWSGGPTRTPEEDFPITTAYEALRRDVTPTERFRYQRLDKVADSEHLDAIARRYA